MDNNKINKRSITNENTIINRNQYNREIIELFMTSSNATIASIEKFADDQLDYINTYENVYHIEKFRLTKGIPNSTYYDWLEKSEYLKKRHNFCLEILALRRKERIADYDPKFLTHTLHMYCPRHDEANKYHASLKKNEVESKPQELKIIFDDYREKVTPKIQK